MIDAVLNRVGNLPLPGFFVTVEFTKEANTFPTGLETFIFEKLERIHQGVKSRKFTYQENGWRMTLTFFPTNQVVDEKYAMKNTVNKVNKPKRE
ncbi:hypothetical protein [Bacteroides sp. 51]|uniref:hypothetical protein n=1 Tax=Bacteroides sp. 51 TaxID=2302938 RepID=UPI0013CFEEC0|nr:hypothetical protein [Bacteroides sp. 51]NDV82599.1 hypothetical protein [Bacteroides sp. 51]